MQLRLNFVTDQPENKEIRHPKEWVKRDKKVSAINKQIVINRQLCLDAITGKKLDWAEAHHIRALGKGGEDTLNNIIVVEPRIHRLIHLLEDRQDIALKYDGQREYRLMQVTRQEVDSVNKWLSDRFIIHLEDFLLENTIRYLRSGGWLAL